MLTIRRAQVQDADSMFNVQQRAFEEEGRRCGTREIPPLAERVDSIAAHIQEQLALVATLEGSITGCVRGVIEQGVCTVRALVVDPARQGAGIGTSLLRALESELNDVNRINLTTNIIMEGNVPFYERHGYRVYEYTQPAPGITLAQMSKVLTGAA
jgi:predicted N-acetyltransferase YhbS